MATRKKATKKKATKKKAAKRVVKRTTTTRRKATPKKKAVRKKNTTKKVVRKKAPKLYCIVVISQNGKKAGYYTGVIKSGKPVIDDVKSMAAHFSTNATAVKVAKTLKVPRQFIIMVASTDESMADLKRQIVKK